jgi:hypothetical protein
MNEIIAAIQAHSIELIAQHYPSKYSENHWTIRLEHKTESGDTVKIDRQGAEFEPTLSAAWDALADISRFGFKLPSLAIEHKPVRHPTTLASEDIPF